MQKIILGIIGLSALALPIFLILTDFNLVRIFFPYQNSIVQTNGTPTPTPKLEGLEIELINRNDFEQRRQNELVIDLDRSLDDQKESLEMTETELDRLVGSESEESLRALFKGSNLILAVKDVTIGQRLAGKLEEKGIDVALYLVND